jgi:hypothetical protein
MDWFAAVLEAIVEVLCALGPGLASIRYPTVGRTQHRAPSEPENWKCPDSEEFARILRGQDSRASALAMGDLPSAPLERSHPLWDRDLDA